MFTGIIETIGVVENIIRQGSNLQFTITSTISNQLKVDQSVAHNGVCLTVVELGEQSHTVTAVAETLSKTSLGNLEIHDKINLERCMKADGRFDGHMVYGHVDTTATCVQKSDQNGSWLFRFTFDPSNDFILVEKGSVCVNGISLTVFDVTDSMFSVAIIPYTYMHTNLHVVEVGSVVNLEFDILGKYVRRMMTQIH